MKVRVWNDNVHPHTEQFKGQTVSIAPKGTVDGAGEPANFVEMDFEDAIQFKGQFTPPVLGADDAPDPRHYKMIRVDWPKQPAVKADPLVCHADGTTAGSAAELAAKILQFSDLRVRDEEAERAKTSEIDALKAQVARLTQLIEGQSDKNGPKRGQKPEAAVG